MSDPFIGQIKPVGYNFAPKDWSLCDGQQLTISSNQALYSLLGDTYGGNSRTFFNLPDFRGRTPLNYGTSTTFGTLYTQGQSGGQQNHTMTVLEMPQHTHDVQGAKDPGTTSFPAFSAASISSQLAEDAGVATSFYGAASNLVSLKSDTVTNAGSGQSYNLVQPTSVLLFIIAMDGNYPQRN